MTLKKHTVPFEQTGQFSKLFIDYISGESSLRDFYSYTPDITSFRKAIEDKSKEQINREVLVGVLKEQYLKTGITPVNAESLLDKNTFTVCTGHQLCLFTGPMYFIYKIISTINLAKRLKHEYPEFNFVPVYWMASEDHDFGEISSVNLFGKKISWNNEAAKGAVGRLKTASLEPVISELEQVLGESENAKALVQLFSEAYLKHDNLSDATRFLVHRLFSDSALLILDADDARLKSAFVDVIKDDISNSTNYKIVTESIKKLNALGYDAQVNPREINVFKMTGNERSRIEEANSETLNLKPGEYSPNVVLRPLYQQMILPNLAYVGGPGELAYWLEYKAMFDHHQVNFPVLIPRNFALLRDEKTEQQITKMGFETDDFFKDTDTLIKQFISKNAGSNLSLKDEELKLSAVYNDISAKAAAVDATLKGSVEAELQKALNALKNIESKLVRSEKQKQETSINQVKKIKDKFFPGGTLQERYDNFAPYYLKSGKALIADLEEAFDPFEFKLLILS